MTTAASHANPEQIHSAVELLQQTVGIPSINANISGEKAPETPLALFLEKVARHWGLSTRKLPVRGGQGGHNLLVTHHAVAGAKWIIFESHLDTVSVAGMTIEPFAGNVADGKLFGRGSCDTKGTGAAMLWALRRYAQQADQPTNVAVLFAVDEEFGMTGIQSFLGEHLAQLDFKPAGIIVGEPTSLRPVIAHNGLLRWKVRTSGVAAHSSDPAKGRSAISAMAALITAVESRYIPTLTARHPLTGKAQCSINTIAGGSAINIIPDHCEIAIDRRLAPQENPQQAQQQFVDFLADLARRDPNLQATVETLFAAAPLRPEASATTLLPVVQRVLTTMGLPTEGIGNPYATDASFIDPANIPTIVLGPGEMAKAHTKDEWVAVDQINRGVDLYYELMRAQW